MKFKILAFTALLTLFAGTPLKAEALPDSILPESKVTTELSPLKGCQDDYSSYRNRRGSFVYYQSDRPRAVYGNRRDRSVHYGSRRGRSRYGKYRGRYGRYGSRRGRSVPYSNYRSGYVYYGNRRGRSVGY